MACHICQNTPEHFSNPTAPCSHQLQDGTDSSKIIYTGPNLECLDEASGVDLETLIKKIDAIACNAEGTDWASFDYGCLEDIYTITSAETYAEAASAFMCQLKADFDNYVDTHDINNTTITNVINTVNTPNFATSCATLGIIGSDTLKAAVQKLINRLCIIDGLVNPSGANWNTCGVVSPAPTTIQAAFNILIQWHCITQGQIEDIISTGAVLPTFDNTGTCLPSPSASESLYNTIVKMRALLCALPSFDESELVWPSCIPEPSDTSLEGVFNAILEPLNTAFQRRIVAVDSNLTLTLNSPGNTCGGYKLSVNPSSGITDKLVAVNSTDTAGYLQDKVVAGSNVTITNSGTTLTVNAANSDHLVLAGGSSDPAGKLIDKIRENITGDNAITLQPMLDGSGTNSNLYIEPTIDYDILSLKILTAIENSTSLTDYFCALACACNPCTSTQGASQLYISVQNTHSDPVTVLTSLTQNNPTLAFYNGNNVIPAASTFTTGQFISNSSISPLTSVLSIKNNYSASLLYDIKVYDASNNVGVPNSSSLAGTITAGQTLTFNSLSFGDYKPSYKLAIIYTIAP